MGTPQLFFGISWLIFAVAFLAAVTVARVANKLEEAIYFIFCFVTGSMTLIILADIYKDMKNRDAAPPAVVQPEKP